jgi:hypothetical protein
VRWCVDNWNSSMPSSGHSAFHDAHVASQQHLVQQKSAFFDCWADDTDSICDLPCLLTYLDYFVNNRHKADARRSPATGGRARRASNGAAAPSSLPSSSSLPQPPLFPRDAPSAAPAPTAGTFAGIHSRESVDMLTRPGSFAFLSDLFDTQRLFELRDFRIGRVMAKGEALEQFAASMHLVLDLADKYPRYALAAHIMDVVAQFLPALLMPCSRRGRVRQNLTPRASSAGNGRSVGNCLRFARKETDNTAKRNHTGTKSNKKHFRLE